MYDLIRLCASALTGLAVFWFAFVVLGIVIKSREEYRKKQNSTDFYDQLYCQLCKQSFVMRNFASVVSSFERYGNASLNEAYDHFLDMKGMTPPWTGSRFFAIKKTEACIIGFCATCGLALFIGSTSLMVGPIFAIGIYAVTVAGTKSEGLLAKEQILRRLPFVVDLMALIRLAGGSFVESLKIVAEENAGHPIGDVFARTYQDSNLGKTQRAVLDALDKRMKDPSFQEVAFSLNKADELGTPVAETLSELAGRMRLKRQQYGETLIGRAQVKIVYPMILIMIACLIIIVMPFVMMSSDI